MPGQHAGIVHVTAVATGNHYSLRKGMSAEQTARGPVDLISAGLQEMTRLQQLIDVMNKTTFNPVGLNIVWPKDVAFIFVSGGSPVVNVMKD